jgi:hypothetical protein
MPWPGACLVMVKAMEAQDSEPRKRRPWGFRCMREMRRVSSWGSQSFCGRGCWRKDAILGEILAVFFVVELEFFCCSFRVVDLMVLVMIGANSVMIVASINGCFETCAMEGGSGGEG